MSVYAQETAKNLRESIDSMLYQTVPPDDFVLVCDGPLPSPLWEVINQYENAYPELFQICKLPQNMGLGTALNVGLHKCIYDAVARMDSDDIAIANRCEQELSAIQNGFDIVSGTVLEFEETVEHIIACRVLPETNESIRKFSKRRNPFNHPCVMFKRKSVIGAGGYRHIPGFEDYDLWVRMLQIGAKGYNFSSPLLYMRTDTHFYRRRGGVPYLKTMLKFRWYLKSIGYSGWQDFFVSSLGQIAICLLPVGWRRIVYWRLLRKPGNFQRNL